MKSKQLIKSVSLVFPMYKDKNTVKKMVLNGLKILKKFQRNMK